MANTEAPTVLMAEISKKETELHRLLGQAAIVSEELKILFLNARKELKG